MKKNIAKFFGVLNVNLTKMVTTQINTTVVGYPAKRYC